MPKGVVAGACDTHMVSVARIRHAFTFKPYVTVFELSLLHNVLDRSQLPTLGVSVCSYPQLGLNTDQGPGSRVLSPQGCLCEVHGLLCLAMHFLFTQGLCRGKGKPLGKS